MSSAVRSSEHRHGSIGDARVQVPDAFFKALAVHTENGFSAVGFVVDNSNQTRAPQQYAVCVDSVETLIGRNLFPAIGEEAEREYDWNVWK